VITILIAALKHQTL